MSDQNKTLIIAEAGVNHNGQIELAFQLIEAAAAAKADFVKFQTFKAEKVVSPDAQKAAYQVSTTGEEGGQLEMLRKLELSEEDHLKLVEHANRCGVKFLSTAFDLESVDLLDQWSPPFFKIPSGEITNLPYLEKVAGKGREIILSTGMANLSEIRQALEVLYLHGVDKSHITILHCNTAYPTAIEDVNLRAMKTIAEEFGTKVGYSDHTLGIEVPIAAVALGATCIEKHFTLDRTLEGPDHGASLEPSELSEMIRLIRNTEVALGMSIKEPTASEMINRVAARRSIHLARPLNSGEIIGRNDLLMKRPGDGISPMRIDEVVGREVLTNLVENKKLSFSDLS